MIHIDIEIVLHVQYISAIVSTHSGTLHARDRMGMLDPFVPHTLENFETANQNSNIKEPP